MSEFKPIYVLLPGTNTINPCIATIEAGALATRLNKLLNTPTENAPIKVPNV